MNFKKLEKKSQEIRKYIFNVVKIRGGHLSTAYSATEILVTLYYTNLLNINKSLFTLSGFLTVVVKSNGLYVDFLFAILSKFINNFKCIQSPTKRNYLIIGGFIKSFRT